jgi:hypothetical protein
MEPPYAGMNRTRGQVHTPAALPFDCARFARI